MRDSTLFFANFNFVKLTEFCNHSHHLWNFIKYVDSRDPHPGDVDWLDPGHVLFFLRFYIYLYLEGGGAEKDGERNTGERSIGCL